MKRFLSIVLCCLLLLLVSCGNEADTSSQAESVSGESSDVDVTEDAKRAINSLNYKNRGKMSDNDGPAFAVYSKKGYNGASVVVDIANSEINTLLPDGRYVNGYCFLGLDVYDGSYWINCADVGLCWSGENGGWHVFYNIYETLHEDMRSWYESGKLLPKNGRYRLTLTVTRNDYVKLTVESLDGPFTDSVEFAVKGALADGSNTSMLFNVALDYPPNTKLDRNGNECEDWTEITLANSDKGLYFKKLHATEMTLFKKGEPLDWEDDFVSSIGIWPDKSVKEFDYYPTEVFIFDGRQYYVNLDMNR